MENSTATTCHSTPAYYENISKHFNWILKNIGISVGGTSHHIVTGAPPFYSTYIYCIGYINGYFINLHIDINFYFYIDPPVQSPTPPHKSAAISSFNLSLTLIALLSVTIMLSYT